MTAEEAKKVLKSRITQGRIIEGKDLWDACQLGIEALKVVLKIRHYPFPDGVLLLPGETKE